MHMERRGGTCKGAPVRQAQRLQARHRLNAVGEVYVVRATGQAGQLQLLHAAAVGKKREGSGGGGGGGGTTAGPCSLQRRHR